MKRYNSVENSGPVMGKANQYWTLWIVAEPEERISWYGRQMIQYFRYQQNLSMDKDSALEKMKERFGDEFRIDETLNAGRSYSNEVSGIEYKDDIFLFGKYKGQKFEDVDDIGYKEWYYSEVKDTEKHSDVLVQDIRNSLIEYNGELIFIDELQDKVMKIFEEEYRKRVHLGKEGDIYSRWVRLRDTRSIDTRFGIMLVYEFVDQDGQLVFYKGSKELDVEKDQIIKLKGKIKHEEYYSRFHGDTVQETSLKYPKILKS